MSTALAIVEDNNHSSTYTGAENLARHIISRMDSVTAKLKSLEDDIRRLWLEFDNLKTGETILGCATKKEFCERKLHRTPRTIQYLLAGQSNSNDRPRSELSSPRQPDYAPLQPNPQPTKPHAVDPNKINRHLVGARIGDVVNYNTSAGTRAALILALNENSVTIQTGTTDRNVHTLPLDIDTGTIRQNMSKAQREPDYVRHTGRAGHCEKCRMAGLPNGEELCIKPSEPKDEPSKSWTTILREEFATISGRQDQRGFVLKRSEGEGGNNRMDRYNLMLLGLTPRQVKLVANALGTGQTSEVPA